MTLAAVKQNGWALENASEELKADKEVVLAAVQNYGCALYYASDELKADKEVIIAAAQMGEIALQYVNKNLDIDSDFVLCVCRALAGKKIQDYPTVRSWIQRLPSFNRKLALSLFTDTFICLDDVMEEETNCHIAMVNALTLLSKDMTDQTTLAKIDSFVGCLSAPSSLIGNRDRQQFEADDF